MSVRETRTEQVGEVVVEYDERVLRPRPWTAAQARWAAEVSPGLPAGPLLELCSGAGHIGLLAARSSGREAVLVDASAPACELAVRNAGLNDLADRVTVRHGDMTAALASDETFPLVLADPPYLPSSDTSLYPEDPRTAIDGGDDGLDLARLCLEVAAAHVTAGGAVLLQLRDGEQAEALRATARQVRLEPVEVRTVEGYGAVVLLVPRRQGPP